MTDDASPLITASELAGLLGGGQWPAIIDVRWRLGGPPGMDSYRSGHLPDAVFLDLDADLSGMPGPGGRHPLPDAADFQAVARKAGVRNGGDVVVYDDVDSTVAARAWWMLRYYGHVQVRVLDGGYRAWVAAGQPTTTAQTAPQPGDFTARPGHMPTLDAGGAAELARSGILLDARAPARYRGETEPVDRVAGHIPGAVSAPTAANVTADGLFRGPAELQARFAHLGIEPGSAATRRQPPRVGAYCGSGVTAAHEVLALELAGIGAALYVGSWSGWVADHDRPVAVGPRPG